MTDPSLDVPQRVIALRKTFVTTPTFTLLRTEFERLLALRQAEIAAGIVGEARSIAVIGASGSGKSTLVARLLSTTPGLVVDGADGRCDVISLRIPSPATLKSVGRAILEALGFPLKRERTADAIWEMVRAFLRERQVLFLHLDEAQDIAGHQTEREKQAVINTLKTLMQHRHWPVGLILSGMPSLQQTLNMDGQLARRVTPIGIPRLSPLVDTPLVTHMLGFYTREAGVACPSGVPLEDLALRLVHAADREFGLLIEITIDALQVAMLAEAEALSTAHFATAFRRRAGCIDGLNPFVVEGYDRLEVRKLLGRDEPTRVRG